MKMIVHNTFFISQNLICLLPIVALFPNFTIASPMIAQTPKTQNSQTTNQTVGQNIIYVNPQTGSDGLNLVAMLCPSRRLVMQ